MNLFVFSQFWLFFELWDKIQFWGKKIEFSYNWEFVSQYLLNNSQLGYNVFDINFEIWLLTISQNHEFSRNWLYNS